MKRHLSRFRAFGVVLTAALFLSSYSASPASAQSDRATGDECANQPSPAEEIACLRRALKDKSDALARTERSADPSQRTVPGQQAAPAPSRDSGRAVDARRAEPAAAPAPVTPSVRELGREQVAGNRKDSFEPAKDPGLQAVVLSIKEDREGLFRITLENGQVWKQAERPSVQILLREEQKYSVEIAKSGFGGYRMYFPEIRRTIVVKRIL